MNKNLLTNNNKNVNFRIQIIEYIKIVNRRVINMLENMQFSNFKNMFSKVEDDNVYSAVELSYLIIKKLYQKKDKRYLPTNMKIQKLLYFSQGYALRKLDKPIIREDFQAWMNGPVIPEVWHNFKYFGTGIIALDNRIVPIMVKNEVEIILDEVIDYYGSKESYELSDLTHKNNTAWTKIREQNKVVLGASSKYIIPNSLIKQEFNLKE